jgi:hypothetical protein
LEEERLRLRGFELVFLDPLTGDIPLSFANNSCALNTEELSEGLVEEVSSAKAEERDDLDSHRFILSVVVIELEGVSLHML